MCSASRVRILVLVFALVCVAACVPQKGAQGPQGPKGGDAPEVEGSSSGGGGFVDENSTRILKMAANGLASMIQNSSPGIFAGLPNGMTQEKLADVIRNVHYEPRKERSREGRSLMFDFGQDAKGLFVVALKPFFVAYSSYPVKFTSGEALMNLLLDVRLKLAHEAAHHLGLGIQVGKDDEAEEFAMRLQASLISDIIHCRADDIGAWPVTTPVKSDSNTKRWDWIWHRPSGVGLFMSTDTWACCEDPSIYAIEVEAFLNGNLSERFKESIHTGSRYDGKYLDRDFGRHSYDVEPTILESGEMLLTAIHPEAANARESATLQTRESAGEFSGEFSFTLPGMTPQKFNLKCEARFRKLQ